MKKLSKETYKRILNGDQSGLMQGIEDLLDMYEAKPFDLGYESCISDLSVHSYRLAEYIQNNYLSYQDKTYEMDTNECAKLIEDYFKNVLKEE